MQIDFNAADYATWTHAVINWYNGGPAPSFSQTQSVANITVVTPGSYRIAGSAVQKPTNPSGTYTLTVAGKNAAGVGAESAPSAPFQITPPAAPSNVVVTNPAV